MKINLNDENWKFRKNGVYYNHGPPKTWYCKKCKVVFPSPKEIGKHTIQVHGFYLPRSRNKPEKQIIVEEVETKPEPPKQTKHSLFSSNRMSDNTRFLPERDYIAEAEQRIEEEKQLKIQGIKQLRAEGYISEEVAQIGVLRIICPTLLPSFLQDLKEKKEREARHKALMEKIAIQTILRNMKNQT